MCKTQNIKLYFISINNPNLNFRFSLWTTVWIEFWSCSQFLTSGKVQNIIRFFTLKKIIFYLRYLCVWHSIRSIILLFLHHVLEPLEWFWQTVAVSMTITIYLSLVLMECSFFSIAIDSQRAYKHEFNQNWMMFRVIMFQISILDVGEYAAYNSGESIKNWVRYNILRIRCLVIIIVTDLFKSVYNYY